MPSLRELQIGFAGAVLNPQRAARFGRHLRRHGVANAQRIQIYRNNLRATLDAALAAVYPVVQKLVGEPCFSGIARSYAQIEPSRSGDIHDYGQRLAEYLETLPQLDGYPYLADVARLEWIYHSLFHSARLPAMPAWSLQQVSPERYAGLRLQLQPGSRLFASVYPVLHIWQSNQDDWPDDTRVSLDEGGVRLLALRGADGIGFVPLAGGEFTLLQALAGGVTLGEACEQALGEPGFDLAAVLGRHLSLGTFTGWQL